MVSNSYVATKKQEQMKKQSSNDDLIVVVFCVWLPHGPSYAVWQDYLIHGKKITLLPLSGREIRRRIAGDATPVLENG